MKSALHTALVSGFAGLAIAVAAGCSAEVRIGGDDSVSKTELQTKVTEELAEAGITDGSVSCDGDLELKDGATQVCRLTVNGETSQVDMTATGGADYRYDIPSALDKDTLATLVKSSLGQELDTVTGEVKCKGALVLGYTQECAVQADDGQWLPISVVGSGIDGSGRVTADWRLDPNPIPAPSY